MKISDIKNPVSTLAGAGPATVKALSNLNIFTIGDLLSFYPRDYEDRSHRVFLNQFELNKKIHTAAKVISHEYFGYGKMRTLKIIIRDETGSASLIAFNRSFLEKSLPVGSIISVTGTFAVKYNELQSSSFEAVMISPEGNLEDYKDSVLPDSGIIPVYRLTSGITRKTLTKLIYSALKQYVIGIDNEIPETVIKKRSLLSKKDALTKIHCPKNMQDVTDARKTLIYEELFLFEKTMLERSYAHKGALPDIDIKYPDEKTDGKVKQTDFSPKQAALLEKLEFSLTKDQIEVINTMNEEIDRGYRERAALTSDSASPLFTMQRLLHGDVGSGKTLVALFAALRVIDWGGQAVFMAPTEILARQHAENIARYVDAIGVHTAFLTGNVKNAGRKILLKELKAGQIDILVGTHAVFSRDVVYKDLQLAIIDEQHRFGVLQRQAIIEKGKQLFNNTYACPHLLMMSATPIPQTLALTVFGDLDISTIKTMPKGRKPVITYLVAQGHEQNAYNAVRQELDKGKQAYFVYPAIEESEEDGESENIKSAEKAFNVLSENYFSNYKCALIHSKIEEEQQSRILDDFRYGKIQLLFATTVVEVGVDVANATCMVIEQADRFGLSQLHQLRGRVGRGSSQGYCFLIYRKNITENGIERIKVLKETTDGFVIAGKDLKLRGPGEITGTIQSGDLQLEIADFSRDHETLLIAREDALASFNQ